MLTPKDLAIYILTEDISHRYANEVINDIFENHSEMIVPDCRDSYIRFKKSISELLNIYELDNIEYREAELIMCEINNVSMYREEDSDKLTSYFKLIKLQLMYSDIGYRKIKLRNLLKMFGYRRRSSALVNRMESTLNALGLKTYLKKRIPCNISTVKLNDMIIIRQ